MIKETDTYYLNISEPNKSTLLALRHVILDLDETISEVLKFRIPCFKYKGKVLCYLWIDEEIKVPYLLMQDGKSINHPGLEKTGHKQIETLRIDPNEDLPIQTITSVLNKGIDYINKK
ncbi:DUF1801 domain-containing protein [Flavivirga eckloniae]|uniref:YdhG-like domain-containing protein n=1 Tax=Flavivirga eckloniae TaxID=1803846 RepID=A0A2K9PLN3_9FLAO|nr:DUF1801 domain-containing protein [Flavivirga eckloniae]AUP77962.1 hypothetical protein C1H87_04240 [Flavivirga eckloniae]